MTRLPARLALVVAANGPTATAAAAIYVVGLWAVFGTSSAYHRLTRSIRSRMIMQRLDHSMIYVLIGASYVPICLVALPPEWGIPMLSVVATLGAVGIVLKLTAYRRLGWLGYALYPIMGWAAVAAGGPVILQYTEPGARTKQGP